MDQRRNRQPENLSLDLGAGIALAAAAFISWSLSFRGLPSFSPEDYIYAALASDPRTAATFLADWRQDNYRPVTHGLVFQLMSPAFLSYGQAAFSALVAFLTAACAAATFLSLRCWGISRYFGIWAAALMLCAGAWRLIPLWNALALNVLFLHLSLCLLIGAVAARKGGGVLLVAATFLGAGSYSVGALFPFLYLLGRRLRGEAWSPGPALAALPFGLPGWLGLASSLGRKFGLDPGPAHLSGQLAQSLLPLRFSPAEAAERAWQSLSFRFCQLFPSTGIAAVDAALFAALLIAGGYVLWRGKGGKRWGGPFFLLASAAVMTIPFLFLVVPFVPRYNWPSDLLVVGFIALCLDRAAGGSGKRALLAVRAGAALFLLARVILPLEPETRAAEALLWNRRITEELERSVSLDQWRQGEKFCLPEVSPATVLPLEPRLPRLYHRRFFAEAYTGIVLLEVRKATGGLGAALDGATLTPHCRLPVARL